MSHLEGLRIEIHRPLNCFPSKLYDEFFSKKKKRKKNFREVRTIAFFSQLGKVFFAKSTKKRQLKQLPDQRGANFGRMGERNNDRSNIKTEFPRTYAKVNITKKR